MSTGRPHHFGHLLKVFKKTLQPMILYISFHDLINVYNRRSGADNPQGTKFWCQQNPHVTSVICYKFQNNLFEVWFYTHFFMILYMYIATGQGLTTHWGQNFEVNRNILSRRSFVTSFKKSLWNLILYICFLIFYTFIQPPCPGQGQVQTAPQGTKFWCQQKRLVTTFVSCKF